MNCLLIKSQKIDVNIEKQEISEILNLNDKIRNNIKLFHEQILTPELLKSDFSLIKNIHNKYCNIIVSSQHSINFLIEFLKQNSQKKIKLFFVGKKTKENFINKFSKFNEKIDYEIFYSKEGNISDLCHLILENLQKEIKENSIIYFRGEKISRDVKKLLKSVIDKINYHEVICYKMLKKTKFSDEFLTNFKQNKFDYIFIYSLENAKHFYNLIKKFDLVNSFIEPQIMCLGEKTYNFLASKNFNCKIFNYKSHYE